MMAVACPLDRAELVITRDQSRIIAADPSTNDKLSVRTRDTPQQKIDRSRSENMPGRTGRVQKRSYKQDLNLRPQRGVDF